MCCEGLVFTFSVSENGGGGKGWGGGKGGKTFLFLTKEKMNENEFVFSLSSFCERCFQTLVKLRGAKVKLVDKDNYLLTQLPLRQRSQITPRRQHFFPQLKILTR